jgi:IS605 OrfB family transposase
MNKETKNMKLENGLFKEGSIFGIIFKSLKCKKDKNEFNIFDVIDENVTCNLVYDSTTRKYKLYVPKALIKGKTKNKKTIAVDLGLRTYATGITENEVVEIGRQKEMKLKRYVDMLRKEEEEKNRKQIIKMLRRKIKYLSTELQWQTINYMTKRYGTIIIGDIHAKEIVKKEGNLGKAQKDLTHALSFGKLKMRLEYKCASRGVRYYCVDEYGTSKICSKCGAYNDVEGSKIYECQKCKMKIDRDVNSCRNIKMSVMK